MGRITCHIHILGEATPPLQIIQPPLHHLTADEALTVFLPEFAPSLEHVDILREAKHFKGMKS